jgi:hypothetical protein
MLSYVNIANSALEHKSAGSGSVTKASDPGLVDRLGNYRSRNTVAARPCGTTNQKLR